MPRTALFSRKSPGGVFTFDDVIEHRTGDIWWVSSVSGSASYDGKTPDTPFATIAAAISAASAGDTIYLMGGHAESKTATGNIFSLSKARLHVIGLGVGGEIATFTLGHAGAQIDVSAANCRIKNIKVIADTADVAGGIVATNAADGLVVEDCWLTDGGLTKELVIGIQIAAACDNVLIQRNRFYTTVSAETGGCASAIKFVGESAQSRVLDNVALGHYTVACVDAGTAASTAILFRGNDMVNIDTDAGLAYKGHASSINLLTRNNWFGTKNNTEPVSAVNASYCGQNFGADAVAAGTIASPAVAAFS